MARYIYANILRTLFQNFLKNFMQSFGYRATDTEITQKLRIKKQGRKSVADFAIDFQTDSLAYRDEPKSLEDLIWLAMRIDNGLNDKIREKRDSSYLQAQRISSLH